jgi:hypothetical protein
MCPDVRVDSKINELARQGRCKCLEHRFEKAVEITDSGHNASVLNKRRKINALISQRPEKIRRRKSVPELGVKS